MTTDESILEEMLERVTNPDRDTVDNLSVQMFCMMVQSNSNLVTKAHELIVKKMHSSNNTQAALAIGLLEECMSKGGVEFQKKTAKFTFLNELIALVSDKHPGVPASIETKKRIMDCLMLWTVEHHDKPKILEAYENLKKQVNFSHGPTTTANVREQRSSILGKDDELVAKLLKQGGEENYKKANLLIQHRFNQEARRTEFVCHLKSELKKVESTMEVLEEMLDSYSPDLTTADSRDVMQELYNTCKSHKEQMARWPDFLNYGEPEFLEDVLNTKDLLMVVIQRYKELFENAAPIDHETPAASTTNTSTATVTNTDLLSELLGDTLNTSTAQDPKPIMSTSTSSNKDTTSTLNELSEIFGIINNDDNNEVNKKPQHPSDLLSNLDLLKPINVFESNTKEAVVTTNGREKKKSPGFNELKEIDKLSEEMFKQSLKEEQRILSFKKDPEKVTLNDLAKDKIQTSLKNSKLEDSKTNMDLKTKQDNKTLASLEDLTNDLKSLKEDANLKEEKVRDSVEKLKDLTEKEDIEVKEQHTKTLSVIQKPLAEISIDLDEVTPLDEGQRLLLDDDLQVTLNFTADRPSQHVSVIVMTVTNKCKFPVKNFQFEASVKKPCKVRLLPPTDVSMAPSKPFRPSAPINQVLLLLNPTENPVDISCIVGYMLGDDPDPIKELIVAKDIPYVQ